MDKKIICHNCKSILPPGSSYCMQCGAKVTDADYTDDTGTIALNPVYLSPGTVLHERYRINSVIGQGGFGITYDGTDIRLNMHVAIKEYFPSAMASRSRTNSVDVTCSQNTASLYSQGLNNFLREAQNMAKFAGEADFVSVHDYFAENNTAYIVMEYVEGQNLKEYLKKRGKLSMTEVLRIVGPVMNALEKIHMRNMIHRDVSPSNIMLLPDLRVKLLDFGAAREVSLESNGLTTMSAVYKNGYSPIEQLTRDMKQGPYSDVYALCATMYEMLTGITPPSPLSRLQKDTLAPPSVRGECMFPSQEQAIMQGLAVYSKDRIQTIHELRARLTYNTFLIYDGPVGGPQRDSTSGGDDRNRYLRIVLGISAAVLVLALAYLVWRGIGGRSSSSGSGQAANADGVSGSPAEQAVDDAGRANGTAGDSAGGQGADPAGEAGNTDTGGSAGDGSGNAAGDENTDGTNTGFGGDATSAGSSDWSAGLHSTSASSAAASTSSSSGENEPVSAIPADAIEYNGHHYYFYDDADTWSKAQDNCIARGGYMAVINDADENEFLYQAMVEQGHEQAFFGLTDSVEEDQWIYLYGDTSDFRDWGMNSDGRREPNNADGYENYAELDVNMHDGHWNDAELGRQAVTPNGAPYGDTYTYICEWAY